MDGGGLRSSGLWAVDGEDAAVPLGACLGVDALGAVAGGLAAEVDASVTDHEREEVDGGGRAESDGCE